MTPLKSYQVRPAVKFKPAGIGLDELKAGLEVPLDRLVRAEKIVVAVDLDMIQPIRIALVRPACLGLFKGVGPSSRSEPATANAGIPQIRKLRRMICPLPLAMANCLSNQRHFPVLVCSRTNLKYDSRVLRRYAIVLVHVHVHAERPGADRYLQCTAGILDRQNLPAGTGALGTVPYGRTGILDSLDRRTAGIGLRYGIRIGTGRLNDDRIRRN